MSNKPTCTESTLLLRDQEQRRISQDRTFSTVMCWVAFGSNCGTLILGVVSYHGKKHPFFMILSYVLLTISILAFRIHRNFSDRTQQRLHYGILVLALILGIIGIHAAVAKTSESSKHVVHRILGWIVVVTFLLQVLFGAGAISFVRRNPNHGLVQVHRVLGPWIYVAGTAVLLDGIIMKCHAVSCVALAVSVGLTTVCSVVALVLWPNDANGTRNAA